MKRFLLTLVCCSPLLFAPLSSFSLNLTGPSAENVVSYEQYGPTTDKETLWGIATKIRPDNSVSIHQTLLAIYKVNPSAFSDGNINRLIEGSFLDLPEFDFIEIQTDKEAADLINRYTTPKAVKPVVPEKKEIIVEQPTPPEPAKEPVVEEKPALVEQNLAVKQALVTTENQLDDLQKEFDILTEQLLVETEKNQSLKLKLQPLYDQTANLQSQIENQITVNQALSTTIDDYRAQLEAVKELPFAGEGLLNEVLRWVTASLPNLLIVILSPVLLLLVLFVVLMRINTKRTLAAQEQELAESTALLMEESGQFDSLLTEDEEQDVSQHPEVDFTSDDSYADDLLQKEPNDESQPVSLEDELECIDLTDPAAIADTLKADDDDPFDINDPFDENEDDPFGLEGLSDVESVEADEDDTFDVGAPAEEEPLRMDEDDPFGIAALADEESLAADSDDPYGIAALTEEESLAADEDDPFGISALTEDESFQVGEDDSLDITALAEEESLAADEEDPFDISALTEEEDLISNISSTEVEALLEGDDTLSNDSDTISEEEQANLDLAAQWESQLAEQNNDELEDDYEAQDNATIESIEDDVNPEELDLSTLQVEDIEAIDLSDLESDLEESEQDDNFDGDDLLAKQLSDVAFNNDVPLPTVDKSSKNDFIDIETLLENSDEGTHEEPYSELDLDLGLDEFPDVINSGSNLETDDENGVAAQLDLARAYLEIDDKEGAKDILLSVLNDSDGAQRAEIEKLLSRIG